MEAVLKPLGPLRGRLGANSGPHGDGAVGMRLVRCSLGSIGRLLAGLFGGSFEASWGPLGASFGPLGCLWGPLGGLLGASWGLLGASWGLLGASWGGRLGFSVRAPPLGPLLGPSWGSCGPSWGRLGPSWRPLGPSWAPLGKLLGRLGVVLEASWTGFNAVRAEKPCMLKYTSSYRKFMILASVGLLGAAFRGLLGRHGGLLGRFGAV